jgi:transposase
VLVDGRPYDVRESRIRDLPMGHRPLEVVWRKRRYRCVERGCPQRVFTERSIQVPPRHRLTARLRAKLESAASRSVRALSDLAAEYGGSWWSVHRALVLAAVATAVPPPVRMLGLDETRARSLRWSWEDGAGRNPWMTSFVDLDTGRPGWLLGLVPGRSKAAVQSWLAAQDPAWRSGIEVVALDPSAPFAAAIRRLLPQATLVVDHWHLVRLANQMVTEVVDDGSARPDTAARMLGLPGFVVLAAGDYGGELELLVETTATLTRCEAAVLCCLLSVDLRDPRGRTFGPSAQQWQAELVPIEREVRGQRVGGRLECRCS